MSEWRSAETLFDDEAERFHNVKLDRPFDPPDRTGFRRKNPKPALRPYCHVCGEIVVSLYTMEQGKPERREWHPKMSAISTAICADCTDSIEMAVDGLRRETS